MKATDKIVEPVVEVTPEDVTDTQAEALEAMDVLTMQELAEVAELSEVEEVVLYPVSSVTEDLIQVKVNVEASDSVLKSQICTLLDQAIQASLVK